MLKIFASYFSIYAKKTTTFKIKKRKKIEVCVVSAEKSTKQALAKKEHKIRKHIFTHIYKVSERKRDKMLKVNENRLQFIRKVSSE